jgi:1-deoxy-D-xylulose-5-phosphate reductoisomerase
MVARAKRLAVLGSTGSIGRQTLEVVRGLPGLFDVIGLAAGANLELLAAQADEFKPSCLSFTAPDDNGSRLSGYERITLEEMAAHPDVDVVVIATAGTAAVGATLAAAKAGKTIALANKESLVAAGEIIPTAVRKSGARLLPSIANTAPFSSVSWGRNSPRPYHPDRFRRAFPRLFKASDGRYHRRAGLATSLVADG